ncbi:cation channel sperm-associated protein subunit beta isoform X2 [Ornithorhynchus anatinus]|uniref:cation channel sperm-associated protein subunit beta isoform X2 n=1 Tax=Ornithorhynchus anatinus TaxID=9258 RepID=UPI0010A87A9A|nr:cation channel sperm-associated protein subunit beta isoform X2 [Ornithorhynchus anatinus]
MVKAWKIIKGNLKKIPEKREKSLENCFCRRLTALTPSLFIVCILGVEHSPLIKQMELLFLFVTVGVLLTLPDCLMGLTYNVQVTRSSSFSCTSKHLIWKRNEMIKLYLGAGPLEVDCELIGSVDTQENRNRLLRQYTSVGLAPSLRIVNSTYSSVFHFKMTLDMSWTIKIPRNTIVVGTDIAATEEWFVTIALHDGLNIFSTEGTLLDIFREPILQWQLGEIMDPSEVKDIIPHLTALTLTQSPCASDVGIIGLICENNFPGIVLARTYSGFQSEDITWFNLTNNLCNIFEEICIDFVLVDIILTNHHFVILSSWGLFISEDLRYPKGQILQFSRANFCGFEKDDYITSRIWYNIQCLANKESFEDDYISISFDKDKTLSQVATCFYSKEPFTEWHSCLPFSKKVGKVLSRRVVSFLVDNEKKCGISLCKTETRVFVSVNKGIGTTHSKKRYFPIFTFPDASFEPVGMFFHPRSHFLYVYGNQVWLSVDGGNTFDLLVRLPGELIVKIHDCVYTQEIIFVTKAGILYITKAGLGRYSKLGHSTVQVFSLYFNHLGNLHIIYLNASKDDILEVYSARVEGTVVQDTDLSFQTPLAIQYISLKEVLLFSLKSEDVDARFFSIHKGKLLTFSPSGSLVIEKVFQHDYPPGYASSVFATIVEKIPVNTLKESPCLNSFLTVSRNSNSTFTLTTQPNDSKLKSNFKVSDIEKTVVIPGYSSFLIFEIINNNSALAYATMPERIPLQTMPKDFWFIYDFGIKAGRKWKISQDPCNYWFQHKNNQSLNVIKYVDLGKTKNFTFRTIPIRQAISEFQMPLLDVIVGNPTLLEVKTKQYWDDIDSYTMEIYVKSKFLQKGSTSIAIVIWKASIECPVTTVILTLKSSCSYGKRMIFASHEKMMHPNSTMGHESEYDTKMKKLPVNYRPPSNLGIAIPLTDNIYNADPSKGRPRDYFPKSRLTGKYKQCANKTSRAECNCTENQKLSDNVAFSDCKEEVPRQKFPVVKYPIILGIVSEDGWIPLEPPYLITMTEVNNRETWKLKDNESLGVEKMKKYLKEENKLTVYNPKGLNLSIMGSELFHFRVTTVPGVTFCPLVVEFQIYVDEVPIAFPGRSLIATTTAIFLGGFIFVTFLIKMYNIHAWDSFKTMLMKKVKISVSSSSLSGQSF